MYCSYTGTTTSIKDKEVIAYIKLKWKRFGDLCEKYLSANKEEQ